MTKSTLIFGRVMMIAVIVMLLFAISASYPHAEKEVTLKDADIAALNDVIDEQKQTIQQLKMQNDALSEHINNENENRLALEMVTDLLNIIHYEPEQVKRAYKVFQETPLNFESSLYLIRYCDLYEIDTALVLSMIDLESNFDPLVVGTSQDRGLMQIIPSTEKWLAESYGTDLGLTYDPELIFEPEYNLGLALSYIAMLKKQHGDNYHRILSEYNRGPYHLAAYYSEHQTYKTSYSSAILSRMKKYNHID